MPSHEKLDYLEFPTRDPAASKAFFSAVFGWTFTDYGPDYVSFARTEAGMDGGFFRADTVARTDRGSSLAVFYSARIDETLAKVVAAGGEVLQPIFDFPGGRRFHFAEPGGSEFAAWSDPA